MIDKIVFCSNLKSLKKWLVANAGNYESIRQLDGNTWVWYPGQTPVFSQNNVSVCLVRNADESLLSNCPYLEVLAEGVSGTDNCPNLAIENDPVLEAKVKLAKNCTPVTYTYNDETITYTPTVNLGVFA